jgi:hypothetical protein
VKELACIGVIKVPREVYRFERVNKTNQNFKNKNKRGPKKIRYTTICEKKKKKK